MGNLPRFLRRKIRLTKWVKGAWSDWLKPYKCNVWFQFAHVLLLPFGVKVFIFIETKNLEDGFHAFLFILASMIILALTEFGRGTVQGYRRALKIIRHDGEFETHIQEIFGRKLYCFRAGAREASIDCQVQQNLIPVLANKWPLW